MIVRSLNFFEIEYLRQLLRRNLSIVFIINEIVPWRRVELSIFNQIRVLILESEDNPL